MSRRNQLIALVSMLVLKCVISVVVLVFPRIAAAEASGCGDPIWQTDDQQECDEYCTPLNYDYGEIQSGWCVCCSI